MSSGSVAIATDNPLIVQDTKLTSDGWPARFIPIVAAYGEDASTDAIGDTNVVETFPGNGIVFFLKNHRPNGNNELIRAGVATVVMNGNVPTPHD